LVQRADGLLGQYQRTGEVDQLNNAIDVMRQALAQTAEDDARAPIFLSNLANALFLRFQLTGKTADLDEAIDLIQRALAALPDEDPNRAAYLSESAAMLHARFRQSGQRDDLERALALGRQAAQTAPPGGPNYADIISTLAEALLADANAAQRSGDTSTFGMTIDEALTLLGQVQDSGSAGLHDRVLRASGLRMIGRYQEAEELLREVLTEAPGDAEASSEMDAILRLTGRDPEAPATVDGQPSEAPAPTEAPEAAPAEAPAAAPAGSSAAAPAGSPDAGPSAREPETAAAQGTTVRWQAMDRRVTTC